MVSNLFPPDVLGGYELLAADVAKDLRGRGHDVQVLTSGEPRRDDPAWVHRQLSLVRPFGEAPSLDRVRHLFAGREQQRRVEVALHRDAVAEAAPRVVEGGAPVDADDGSAGVALGLEEGRGAGAAADLQHHRRPPTEPGGGVERFGGGRVGPGARGAGQRAEARPQPVPHLLLLLGQRGPARSEAGDPAVGMRCGVAVGGQVPWRAV